MRRINRRLLKAILVATVALPVLTILFALSVVLCCFVVEPLGSSPGGIYLASGGLGAAVACCRIAGVRWHTILAVLAWAWLGLLTPTFGVMTLLIAARLQHTILLTSVLTNFTGITLSFAYKAVVPSFEVPQEDHPFPPLSHATYLALALVTLGVASVAVIYLLRHSRARLDEVAPIVRSADV